jgi:hypothetical protein
MNHHYETETEKEIITLADVTAGANVRLHHMTVQLDEVDQLGPCDARGSAAHGLNLTEVSYLRRGQRRRQIYLSNTPVERLAS